MLNLNNQQKNKSQKPIKGVVKVQYKNKFHTLTIRGTVYHFVQAFIRKFPKLQARSFHNKSLNQVFFYVNKVKLGYIHG